MKADGSILQSNMNVFCNLIDGLEPGACPLLLPNGLKAIEPNTRTLLMFPVTQGAFRTNTENAAALSNFRTLPLFQCRKTLQTISGWWKTPLSPYAIFSIRRACQNKIPGGKGWLQWLIIIKGNKQRQLTVFWGASSELLLLSLSFYSLHW